MVYQEQVMQVAQVCAGYSLGGADLLRRAMGKKIASEMAIQRRIFVHGDDKATPPVPGAVRLGMTEDAAESLFDTIVPFAGYGFNKSHAAAYAWIGYQTAWMKVHYPAEYLSALMSYYTDKPDRLSLIKDELDALKVPLLPPDVNHSHSAFRPEPCERATGGYAVRFGLGAIKGISGVGSDLSSERDGKGSYTSLEDFQQRVGTRFNKGQLERLAEVGAFEGLARSRRAAAEALAWLSDRKSKAPAGQADMFGGGAAAQVPPPMLDVPEWGDVAEREFKGVGFYFSRHPIDPFIRRLYAAGVRRRHSFFEYMLENDIEEMEGRRLCVMVESVQTRVSPKRGTTYLEAQVSERGDTYRISCFENYREKVTLEDFRRVLEGARTSRKPVVLKCSLSMDRERKGLWVNGRDAWSAEEFLAGVHGDLVMRLAPSDLVGSAQAMVATLQRKLQGAAGNEGSTVRYEVPGLPPCTLHGRYRIAPETMHALISAGWQVGEDDRPLPGAEPGERDEEDDEEGLRAA
jgi:DNA polymerase-3 subunit alpha